MTRILILVLDLLDVLYELVDRLLVGIANSDLDGMFKGFLGRFELIMLNPSHSNIIHGS